MKIMFHLNCLEKGGAERVVSTLANTLSGKGHEVVVAAEWKGEDEFQLLPGVKHLIIGLKPEDENKNRISQFFIRLKNLEKCLAEERPDVLVPFAQKAIYRALMAQKKTGSKVITAVRTVPAGHYDHFSDRLLIPFLFPRAAGCVFQTSEQRDYFKPHIPEKTRIILNPVNDRYLNAEYPSQRTKRVVTSGRIVDFKNQSLLIDAFMDVHEEFRDHSLEIYGPDSHDGTKEILERKIAGYGAGSFIRLMGGCDDLENRLRDAAVYAFSSDWEGLPNALIEAMVMGLPVVATDCPCGGPAEIIEDGVNGLLVPIKDRKALADGMKKLIKDSALAERLGRNAMKLRDKTDPEIVSSEWCRFLESFL